MQKKQTPPRRFFIAGTGTGVGKTYCTVLFARQLRQKGLHVAACKPVISGFSEKDAGSDTARIAEALGLSATPETFAALSPWRFNAPLSPHSAAEREGRAIDAQEVANFSAAFGAQVDIVLVESAGGIMSPLTRSATVLDWAERLGAPVILVAGSYLGALSHTLTAHAALSLRRAPLAAIIVSESEESAMAVEDMAETLRGFINPTPVMSLPRSGAPDMTGIFIPNNL